MAKHKLGGPLRNSEPCAAEDGLRDFIHEYATRLGLPRSHAVRRLVLLGIKYETLANAGEVRVTRTSELLGAFGEMEAAAALRNTEEDDDPSGLWS